jgi:hypothetical protein
MLTPGFFFLAFLSVKGEHCMNSYLVRIYRRAEDNPRMLVGVVEEIGKAEKRAFNSLDELWDILNPGKKGGNQPGKARDRKKRESSEEATSQ